MTRACGRWSSRCGQGFAGVLGGRLIRACAGVWDRGETVCERAKRAAGAHSDGLLRDRSGGRTAGNEEGIRGRGVGGGSRGRTKQ